MPGLGHDQLERDLLAAEVGRRGVAELAQPRSSFRARHSTAPGTRRPRVRTTLAAAALAGTVPTTLPRSNVVTLSAVDGGANAIPLDLPAAGRTKSPGTVTALSRSGQPG